MNHLNYDISAVTIIISGSANVQEIRKRNSMKNRAIYIYTYDSLECHWQ